MCVQVKDLISICRKRVGLSTGGIVTKTCCIHYASSTKSFTLGSPTLLQLASLGESDPNVPLDKFPLGQQSGEKKRKMYAKH